MLREAGFTPANADPSLFVQRSVGEDPVYILLYVDYILILSSNMERVRFAKSLLQSKFDVKDLGEAKSFLGMQILQSSDVYEKLVSNNLLNERSMTELLKPFTWVSTFPGIYLCLCLGS